MAPSHSAGWKSTSLFESICSHKIFQDRQCCRQVWTVWHVSVPFFVPSDFMEHFQNPFWNPFWDSKASKLSSVASEAFLAELAHGRQGSGHHAQKLHVAGHHAQQSADLQPRNGTLPGIMPSKVSVPGRTCTLLGIMPSNAWGLQTECSLLLGMMPSNAPGFGWQHVTGHHAQQWTHVFFFLVWDNALL